MLTPKTILCVVGARPNFMKIAPIMRALAAAPGLCPILVHTGQHYDQDMNDSFFADLAIPAPDVNLGVGSASHAVQTAEVMRRFEPVLEERKPDAVLVVGDVNSTLACTLVAVKRGIPVFHVEAGLRSFDRTMPEEINRVLTDQISDLLFTTEENALANLLREGIAAERVHFAGNVMIDTLRHNLDRAVPADTTLAGFPDCANFAVLTLHRPANVDEPAILADILGAVSRIAERLPVVFPVHPRTRLAITAAGLDSLIADARILLLPPQGYLSMLGLMAAARVVLTDSGGIQEETTALGVPCLTLRDATERPITVTDGTNTIVGRDPACILAAFDEIEASGGKRGCVPHLWDGHAAERIAAIIGSWLA